MLVNCKLFTAAAFRLSYQDEAGFFLKRYPMLNFSGVTFGFSVLGSRFSAPWLPASAQGNARRVLCFHYCAQRMDFLAQYWRAIYVGIVILLVFIVFVKEWVSPDLVAMSALVAVVLPGIGLPDDKTILPLKDALSVFGNAAPITVACMFILSAALERTGVIEAMGGWFERIAGKQELRVLVVTMILVAPLSAFVNNTPVVVVFMPIMLAMARKHNLMASRLLIPLSYAAIVGGTCTLIGTSTNIIASSIAVSSTKDAAHAIEPFSMFEISKLGLIFVAIAFTYILTVGRKMLPDRVTLSTLFETEDGKEFFTQVYIRKNSPLAEKAFSDTPLPKIREVRIIEVTREGRTLKTPLNRIVFREGDQLLLKSRVEGVMGMSKSGLDLGPKDKLGLNEISTESAVLMEGIVGPDSKLAGKSLKQLNFRQRYGVLILALHRRGVNLRNRFEDVKLAFGDTLLVEGPQEKMNALFAEKDFINLSQPKQRPLRRNKAPIAIGVLLAFILLGALTRTPIVLLALTGVLVTLLSKCIDVEEAYESVGWKVIFMIFGMLGLGKAMEHSEGARILADQVVFLFGDNSPYVVLSVIYLLAAILTEIISNNAVAALLTPLAIGVAVSLGANPQAFVIAVMFGSSASFSTPIGYQTNTYVYGAGGYKFGDFCKIGIPLALILWIVASICIPFFWPL